VPLATVVSGGEGILCLRRKTALRPQQSPAHQTFQRPVCGLTLRSTATPHGKPLGRRGALVYAAPRRPSALPRGSRLAQTLGVMTRSLLYSTAASLALAMPSAASVASEPNAAFDEQFIWAISVDLARDLSRNLNLKQSGVEPERVNDQRRLFEILYFNELVSCETPLSRLVPALAAVKVPKSSSVSGVASPEIRQALQEHRDLIQLEISAWNKSAKQRVVRTYLANSWSISPPTCIHSQALNQIPALRPPPR
jgi:hypothetical protein